MQLELIRSNDVDVFRVPVTDAREISIPLRSGERLIASASPAGLISAADFLTADGGVVRFEKRLVESLTGLLPSTAVEELISRRDAEDVRADKALIWGAWQRLPTSERANFLKVISPVDWRRAAA